mgnify:CR=1 FL=1
MDSVNRCAWKRSTAGIGKTYLPMQKLAKIACSTSSAPRAPVTSSRACCQVYDVWIVMPRPTMPPRNRTGMNTAASETVNALILLSDGHDFELINPVKTGAAEAPADLEK